MNKEKINNKINPDNIFLILILLGAGLGILHDWLGIIPIALAVAGETLKLHHSRKN